MKFALLIYQDEKRWADASADERRAIYARHDEFIRRLAEAGSESGGEELAPSAAARTLRRRGDDLVLTDGPYAETTEHLGGFYIIEADSLEQAVEYARDLPGAGIEVRPVAEPPMPA